MMYQLRLLADMSDIGDPAPAPAALAHLTDPELADLSWIDSMPDYEGKGLFPVDAMPPDAVRRITRILLLQRFTPQERIPIRVASKTDPIVEDFLAMLSATEIVELDNADTLAGFGYLVMEGLLTQERADAILA